MGFPDTHGETNVQSAGPLSIQGRYIIEILLNRTASLRILLDVLLSIGSPETGSHDSSRVYGDNISMELRSVSNVRLIEDQVQQEEHQIINSEFHPNTDELQRPLHHKENNAKLNACTECSIDLSQISGPNERSRPTPLSQIGFRDPASTGAGQQLTMLSIEVFITAHMM